MSGLLRETSALRNALRLAVLLGRVLLLPPTCAFTKGSGLVPPPPLVYHGSDGRRDDNVLDDAVDADWCTVEWFFDLSALKAEFAGYYREASFLSHPLASAALAKAQAAAGGVEAAPPTLFIDVDEEWRLVPPSSDALVLTPAHMLRGATDAEVVGWLAPYANAPLLEMGDLAGRLAAHRESDQDDGKAAAAAAVGGAVATTSAVAASGAVADASVEAGAVASEAEASALTARVMRGVAYREEIRRHVRQQVQQAAPFDCLCLQGAGIDVESNLTHLVQHFAATVPRNRAVFVAGYRVDLLGLDAFQRAWERVYALALYDWNGAGLQGRQFSSTINRLICKEAEVVHSWVPRVTRTRECW